MSKYLEYTRHANTGATKNSAPVLGTFLNRDKLALEALCEEIRMNGGAPMDSETLLYILSGTVDYLREQFATKCVRYRFFGITFEVACYGPFETADAKFDPAVNSLEVAVRLGEDLKNCLVNVTPTLVRGDGLDRPHLPRDGHCVGCARHHHRDALVPRDRSERLCQQGGRIPETDGRQGAGL